MATQGPPQSHPHATFMRPQSQGGGILGFSLLKAILLFAAGDGLSRCAGARERNPGQEDPARDCCRSRLCGRLYSYGPVLVTSRFPGAAGRWRTLNWKMLWAVLQLWPGTGYVEV